MFKKTKLSQVEPKAKSLSEIRSLVIEYYNNPKKYIDMDRGDMRYDEFVAPIKPIGEVIGCEHLGSGMYSDVFALGENKALKIVKGTDEGYERFVKLCQENKGNKHLPVIYYAGKWGKKRVYILERLQPFTDRRDNEAFREAVRTCSRNKWIAMDTDIGKVSALLGANNMLGDLHGQNVMLRGDCPVVTDPYAY